MSLAAREFSQDDFPALGGFGGPGELGLGQPPSMNGLANGGLRSTSTQEQASAVAALQHQQAQSQHRANLLGSMNGTSPMPPPNPSRQVSGGYLPSTEKVSVSLRVWGPTDRRRRTTPSSRQQGRPARANGPPPPLRQIRSCRLSSTRYISRTGVPQGSRWNDRRDRHRRWGAARQASLARSEAPRACPLARRRRVHCRRLGQSPRQEGRERRRRRRHSKCCLARPTATDCWACCISSRPLTRI